ncbi:Merozoite surface protein 1 [Frankliniella fusca]|uniref:Merozoite surface protein 1 n=1 Tax=Frankliniella fusca TaxID=407009 RepID=A0AAE1HIG9_9NEOP|nr:Merozoite surface protein 1 [Frankliniella fusca]
MTRRNRTPQHRAQQATGPPPPAAPPATLAVPLQAFVHHRRSSTSASLVSVSSTSSSSSSSPSSSESSASSSSSDASPGSGSPGGEPGPWTESSWAGYRALSEVLAQRGIREASGGTVQAGRDQGETTCQQEQRALKRALLQGRRGGSGGRLRRRSPLQVKAKANNGKGGGGYFFLGLDPVVIFILKSRRSELVRQKVN